MSTPRCAATGNPLQIDSTRRACASAGGLDRDYMTRSSRLPRKGDYAAARAAFFLPSTGRVIVSAGCKRRRAPVS